MSLAHFSPSNHHLPETLWYHPYPVMDSDPKIPNHSSFNFNINNTHYVDDNNNNNTQQQENVNNSKEPMFEKPLTPSDVGKLNRLVIPKQHAEKYFPLANGNGNGDVDQQQKGLLLSFEDEAGKPWRFRYSYWNSSQSYVLTKGWSRFVKEKRLDAGDVVLFERHRFDCDRLFIGWRRRPAAASAAVVPMLDGVAVGGGGGGGGQMVGNGWTTGSRGFYDAHYNYPSHHHLPLSLSSPHPYQPHCLHAAGGGGINDNVENKQRDMVSAPRRVRLFGVNLECPDESEPSTPDGSSHGQTHYQYHNNLNLNHDMNINFSQMRYQQHQG